MNSKDAGWGRDRSNLLSDRGNGPGAIVAEESCPAVTCKDIVTLGGVVPGCHALRWEVGQE